MFNRNSPILLVVFAMLLIFAAMPVFAQSDDAPPTMITTSLEAVIIASLALGAFLYDIIRRIYSAWQDGRNPDIELVEAIDGFQDQREAIEFWERQYQRADDNVKRGYDLLSHAFEVLSRYTPWDFDDRLSDLLKDIQQPGAPDAPESPLPGAPTGPQS